MSNHIVKKLLILSSITLGLHTLHATGNLDFSNWSSQIVLKDANASIKLNNPNKVMGWSEFSIVKSGNRYTEAENWKEIQALRNPGDSVTLNEGDLSETLIISNSNAINALDPRVTNNSNAIMKLEQDVTNNSNAIVVLDENVRYNSQALLAIEAELDAKITNNSNAIIKLEQDVTNNSNAIVVLDENVRYNSQALLAITGDLEDQITNNSNAIIKLEQDVTNNSNAIVVLDENVRYNSNLLVVTYNELMDIDPAIIGSRIDNLEIFVRNNSTLIVSNSNSIVLLDDRVTNNSNAIMKLEQDVTNNSNAINYMASEYTGLIVHDDHVVYADDATVSSPELFKAGFSVAAGKTLQLDATLPVSGNINLADTGILQLNGDIVLDSKAYLTSGGIIKGEGHTLLLTSSLVVPAGKTLTIGSNMILDGQGNNIVMEAGAKIQLDTASSFTLRNLNWFNNGDGAIINITNENAQVTLDNVNTAFDTDVAFNNGYLFIANDVNVQGPKKLSYASTKALTVEPFAQLKFDVGSTFSFSPNPTGPHNADQRKLLRMSDSTSEIFFNNSTLVAPDYGIQLTKGTILFDNKIQLEGNTDAVDEGHSIEFGDGTADGEAEIKVLSGANVTVNGYLFHNTLAV